MPLPAGIKLGPYEIVAQIGEGGPPPLASQDRRELRRGLAEAQLRPRL